MPKYTVTINHIYEDIEEIEVEADDEMEAHDKAEALAEPNNAWDHAQAHSNASAKHRERGLMQIDFETAGKKKPAYTKPKSWVKCLDCRAIIADRIADRYPTCPFCEGANWSIDQKNLR